MEITTDINTRKFYDVCENADFVFYYLNSAYLPNDKHHTIFAAAGDFVYVAVNNKTLLVEDAATAELIKKLIFDNLEDLKRFSEKEKTLPHIKASSKNQISISVNDEDYTVSTMVDDAEISDFYNRIEPVIRDTFKSYKETVLAGLEDVKETNLD